MIRKVVTPQKQDISIHIPEDFIGKAVEIIAFTIDETVSKQLGNDKTVTHFASEHALAKDWLTAEEDKAWQDL